ncbi:glutaminase [Tenacibaculum finnmarkense genomovar ulcerans]|uniref:glutaminase n=1 Tax=Tenacibaculum finnmarkense TaxID=2781243 RepID=UPI001E301234|nr:glutaminase [Tenacibaculum finnmarkense]MCD8421604.1 glutaminase [Tenacibaculum finnmarkense genomovar ulcerans]MCG8784819.1 glutaminase [Tenacibaculum finnmarkense]
MNHKKILADVFLSVNAIKNKGALASYIPELANLNPNKFGVHISTTTNFKYGVGDFKEKFSIQSIAKVVSLCLAYKMLDGKLWDRLGVEPSGNPFNSLLQLEKDNGIPRNPFINAGAIVICDILISNLKNPKEDLLTFIKGLSGNNDINYSEKIAASEKSVGYRNVALCNFIKSFGNIENEPNKVLDFYFDLCSLELSCEHLSELFLFLANNGKAPHNNEQIITRSQSKRINALMQTCGFYDESGQFAFKVGLAGKSGVGGGIIAIHPNKYSIAVWSPKLNEKGNSYKAMKFLEGFTSLSEESIF